MAQKSLSGPAKKLVVIGGSAGSLEVVLRVLPQLPRGCETAIILVLHRRNDHESPLSEVLSSRTAVWMIRDVEDKDELRAQHIYIAPADYHLLVEGDGTVSLDCSEKVHYSRPSIDLTFQTAADAYGEKLGCLLLSGANADGVDGLRIAQQLGATIAVQNPETAVVPYMPQQAMEKLRVDHVLQIEEMAGFVGDFCGR